MSPPNDRERDRELLLVTYNIHSAIGVDRRFDLERTAEVLRELDPDVVALQEVGDFRGRTTRGDHAERLGRALGFEHAFGPNVVRGERRYGNAVLSRFPIESSWNLDLSCPGCEPRGALQCELALGAGERLTVVSVHLGLGPRERRIQEEKLAHEGVARSWGRLVVAGDFNHLRDGAPTLLEHRDQARRLRDVARVLRRRERTCPSRVPLFRFDRVLASDDVEPRELFAHRSKLARAASDHLPLAARLAVAS